MQVGNGQHPHGWKDRSRAVKVGAVGLDDAHRTAHCSADATSSPPRASTSAPLEMRNSQRSVRLLIAAQCRHVMFSGSRAVTSAPVSTIADT